MKDLVNSIIADGVVDADEVAELQAKLYEDGKIDKEEAEALFQINDAVSGNDNDPAYGDLFVKAISDFVLEDDETPGVIDEEEGAFLVEKIQGDGEIDVLERRLLNSLKENAKEINHQGLNDLINS